MNKSLKSISLLSLTNLLTFGLCGQNASADKLIMSIESFKRYEVFRINNETKAGEETLKSVSDSTMRLTELVLYTRKKKSNKVTEISISELGITKRTYYFNDNAYLFAIIDSVKRKEGPAKLMKYYFGGGRLTQVIDENNTDVMSSINKNGLYHRIRRMFDE